MGLLTKNSLRDSLRNTRAAVSDEMAVRSGNRLIPYLFNFLHFKHWLLYAPIQNEISTRPVFDFLKAHQCSTYFPRIDGDAMDFFSVQDWGELKLTGLIPEPSVSAERFSGFDSAIVLVPGVGFSYSGHRLGFGRGYFDRYLSRHSNILRVGIGYSFQILPGWPAEDHDQTMDFAVTPNGMWSSKRLL